MKDNALQKKLKAMFSYDPVTGIIMRIGKVKYQNRPLPYQVGLMNTTYGSSVLSLDGKNVAVQRVIWAMVTGKWPDGHRVGFKNGNPLDFRWDNLAAIPYGAARKAMLNKGVKLKSGATGVYYTANRIRPWKVSVCYDKRQYFAGSYATVEEAIIARDAKLKHLEENEHEIPLGRTTSRQSANDNWFARAQRLWQE